MRARSASAPVLTSSLSLVHTSPSPDLARQPHQLCIHPLPRQDLTPYSFELQQSSRGFFNSGGDGQAALSNLADAAEAEWLERVGGTSVEGAERVGEGDHAVASILCESGEDQLAESSAERVDETHQEPARCVVEKSGGCVALSSLGFLLG